MNTIEATTVYAPTFSSRSVYRAALVINGKRTNVDCGHSHKSRDLAMRCAERKLPPLADALRGANLMPVEPRRIGKSVWHAFWRDADGVLHTRTLVMFD
jgi:hypothetical protein